MLNKVKSIVLNVQFQKLVVYGFGQLFNLVTPLLIVPYIVGICGEENFGKVAVGMALSFFMIVFIDYGSDLVGVREVSINRHDDAALKRIVITNYTSRFLILLVILLFSVGLFFTVPYFKSEKNLFIFGLTILIGQFLNPTWFLQGVENVKWITLSNIISKLIYLLGVFIMVRSAADYVYVNFLWGLGMILANGFMLLLIFRKHHFTFYKVPMYEIKNFLKKDFFMFSSQIFVALQLNTPVMLVSFFGSNLMAGQYKIVEQIIVIFKTYIFLFFNYVFPKMCYLLENNLTHGLRNWKIYNGVNFFFVLLGMVFFSLFSYEVVSYFNPTNRYVLSSLLNVAVAIPVLMAVSIALKQLVLGWNFKRFYVRVTSIMVVINLLAIIIVLPYYKVYGVFYSLIASEVLMILFYLICIRKKIFSKETA
ncbi:MAG TPA: oligosaccharide flippase family protein [Flavobacterium sp.]|uniref:oligosaccharide flippase family protein n=1 Tax=Flavobacterium sp. TaxID=239 RepID=UPI002D186CD4|nr:oligosaccharide flippase family protein [Flavobacterium sp.]HSD14320.1 oligosaccharide flippase family protein [Flavobacterium sp.]